jgi:hypothetical protein
LSPDATAFPGAGEVPPPVGAYVAGSLFGSRQIVRWAEQFRDAHELADHVNPDGEAYLSLFCYPEQVYAPHFVRAGYSPRGYTGPAACHYLLFDVDRKDDLSAALADTRVLARFVLDRWPKVEGGVGAYFSGKKGFHLLVELLPGFAPTAAVPATARRLALAVAARAGVRIDPACYDHQRLVRLPNSRHPATGLYKRYLSLDELFALDVGRILELARHPAGYAVPSAGEHIQELEDDWVEAAATPGGGVVPSRGEHPVVPKFVRDFIGWQDIQEPGRALTVFRCAAALAEAGTPDAVVVGLLEEPAVKTGLEPGEVAKQIRDGIARGRRKDGAG